MVTLKRLPSIAAAALAAIAAPLSCGSTTIQEDFSSSPALSGWQIYGDTNLFSWDSTNQDLRVVWDSSQTNSYFYHPLGTTLSRQDNFGVSFDLRLNSIGPGPDTNKPYTFEIALGFLNLTNAIAPGFLRGTGSDATNLVEFDYFWDSGYGATVWPQFVGFDGSFNYNGENDYTIYALQVGELWHVDMTYSAREEALVTTLTRNGVIAGPIHRVPLNSRFTDFAVDTFAISSYSDLDGYGSSVLATGVVDNLRVIVDPQPVGRVKCLYSGGAWQVDFSTRTNWTYTLERTTDCQSWATVSLPQPGTGTRVILEDSTPPAVDAFYRVHAQSP